MKPLPKNEHAGLWLTLIFSIAGTVLLLSLSSSLPQTALADLPPRKETPTVTLPSRPKPDRAAEAERPVGAYIELRVQPAQAGLWSVVQWQDAAGNWHDVEGWRGTVEGVRVWWVAEADFGKGPFRWVIYQGQDGPRLATSTPFNLPSEANQTVQIQVSSGL